MNKLSLWSVLNHDETTSGTDEALINRQPGSSLCSFLASLASDTKAQWCGAGVVATVL